jgi:allophanate hydrolase subunit 2
MHEGVPPGGALVAEHLAMANAAADNAPGEAGIEVFGAITLAADEPLLVGADGDAGRWLRAGEPWSVATAGARVRYAAIRGGVDAPLVLGGRGTLLAAGFGGHEGRPLRRGDVLRASGAPPRGSAPTGPRAGREPAIGRLDLQAPIRVLPGPDGERFALEALALLLSEPFEVTAQSDRVGVRLRGARLARTDDDSAVSAPMVRGAIQVPVAGEPIVLGPDHPTTGGYPVIATVVRDDVGALMARPLGATVRFSLERHEGGPAGIHQRSA